MTRHVIEDADDDLSSFWLITYSDMTTLLLTFFLVIYAFTAMNDEGRATLIDSLNVVATGGKVEELAEHLSRLKETGEEIAAMLDDHSGDDKPWVRATENFVVVGLPASITFASGRVDLTDGAKRLLLAVASRLKNSGLLIRVEGHTDSVPITGGFYSSNWHLSVARAQSVVKVFLESGIPPHRLQVVGRADTHPIADNNIDSGRRANRRIEIRLIRAAAAEVQEAVK